MSSKGICLDNSAMENFFGRLKVEFFTAKLSKALTLSLVNLKIIISIIVTTIEFRPN